MFLFIEGGWSYNEIPVADFLAVRCPSRYLSKVLGNPWSGSTALNTSQDVHAQPLRNMPTSFSGKQLTSCACKMQGKISSTRHMNMKMMRRLKKRGRKTVFTHGLCNRRYDDHLLNWRAFHFWRQVFAVKRELYSNLCGCASNQSKHNQCCHLDNSTKQEA